MAEAWEQRFSHFKLINTQCPASQPPSVASQWNIWLTNETVIEKKKTLHTHNDLMDVDPSTPTLPPLVYLQQARGTIVLQTCDISKCFGTDVLWPFCLGLLILYICPSFLSYKSQNICSKQPYFLQNIPFASKYGLLETNTWGVTSYIIQHKIIKNDLVNLVDWAYNHRT